MGDINSELEREMPLQLMSNMSESGARRVNTSGRALAANYQHHHNYTVQKVNALGLANYRDKQNREQAEGEISATFLGKPPFDKSMGINRRSKLDFGGSLFRNRPFSSENKYGNRAGKKVSQASPYMNQDNETGS